MFQITKPIAPTPSPQPATRRPPPRPPKRRFVRLLQPPTESHPVGLLQMQVGDEPATCYLVENEENEFGFRAFVLIKLSLVEVEGSPGQFQHENGPPYHVLLDGAGSLCSCAGYERHGMCHDGRGCRHIAACAALVRAGLL
jgi:hypothetical protein